MTAVLTPRSPPYPDDIARLLARYPDSDRYLLGLFRVFANSARFLAKGVQNLLDANSPLSLRERELVILRVTANLGCEYEWGVHAAIFAERAGLDDAMLRATTLGDSDADVWSEDDVLLLAVVDALCRDGHLPGATLDRFRRRWDHEQQLEILALAGNYHTVAFVANASELEPEPFARPLPAAGQP